MFILKAQEPINENIIEFFEEDACIKQPGDSHSYR